MYEFIYCTRYFILKFILLNIICTHIVHTLYFILFMYLLQQSNEM